MPVSPAEFTEIAKGQESVPVLDVAFIDNARELDPLVARRVVRTMIGEDRFGSWGWWVTFDTAKHNPRAEAFLRWLSRSPTWKPMSMKTNALSWRSARQAEGLALEAISCAWIDDVACLWRLSEPRAASRVSIPQFNNIADLQYVVSEVRPLLTFGTSSLAIVVVSALISGDEVYGLSHSAVVATNADGAWKALLLLTEALPYLEEDLAAFDDAGITGVAEHPPSIVEVVRPSNGARLLRFPSPTLEWIGSGSGVVLYVIEHEYSEGFSTWNPSYIYPVGPTSHAVNAGRGRPRIQLPAPFGVGAQPHRWRVWAIGEGARVSINEWRTIHFMN
jgi:hypothetical protein